MYRVIDIHPSQRNLQRIVCGRTMSLVQLKLSNCRQSTYGTVSTPFLATRTLIQIAKDEGHNFPLAAPIVKDEFYVDGVLSGAKNLSLGIEMQQQLTSMLKQAGMSLHKWRGNHPQLSTTSGSSCEFSNSEIKTLGVTWNPTDDCFCFKVSITSIDVHMSIQNERLYRPSQNCLTLWASDMFGPMFGEFGYVCDIVITYFGDRIFLQKLWLLNLHWDDRLPSEIHDAWDNFCRELQPISNIRVEICILPFEFTGLHGFSDASEVAYGVVVHCKSQIPAADVAIRMVDRKSRFSPLKKLTVPRLELSAAVLLAKLMYRIQSALHLDVC